MLDAIPLVFILLGVVFYVVLAGADFGAGVWQLLSPGSGRPAAIRDLAHHSMGPVWEANHVWIIFVVTVSWTAYPVFLGSVASTLAVGLFLAALGIIMRGASYALRSGAREREMPLIDAIFGIGSLLAPFALGACAGAIASERVPVGNASGHLFTSWLNPTSIFVGVLSVVFCAYLAAVYLAADAVRHGHDELVEPFRHRALGSGAVAGAVAIAGLFVLHGDAHSLYSELLHGAALVVVIISVIAGAGVLALTVARRYELARFTVAIPIAAVIAAWAFARYPTLLPGLSVHHAAAPHDTLVCLIVAVFAGGALLFPSLGYLFRVTLRGMPDDPEATAAGARGRQQGLGQALAPRAGWRVALALLIVGIGTLNAADAGWAHVIGVFALFGFMISLFAAIVPRALAAERETAAGP